MKKLYIAAILFYCALSFSQESLGLSDFTPPSPEAQALTKYANLDADEFRGMVNYNLPLYNYKAGKLSLPLSLHYRGAGVKVADLPTWVGMNWTLQAGGVITRATKDKPDEMAIRIFLKDSLPAYNYIVDGTTEGLNMRNILTNSSIDSELDIFNFSFAEYSGSFYLNKNMEAVQLKNEKSLVIVPIDTFAITHKFKITTPDGIIYWFGGLGATESTTRRTVVNGSHTTPDTSGGVTAFYLTSIEHPGHGSINIEYHEESIRISTTQSIQKVRKIEFQQMMGGFNCVSCPDNVVQCVNDESLPLNENIAISTRVYGAKNIYRISNTFNSDEVLFSSAPVNADFNRVLNKISINKKIDGTMKNFRTIDLQYHDYGNSYNRRIFLKKVILDKDSPDSQIANTHVRNEIFEFKYNSPSSLPGRFSPSQDFAGYYNGKSNSSSIPDCDFINPLGNPGFADRNPSFAHASTGVLTHIYYPTGGHTLFDYQAKPAKKKRFRTLNLYAYRNQQHLTDPNKLMDGIPRMEENNFVGIFNVIETHIGTININLKAVACGTTLNHYTDFARLTITKSNATTSETETVEYNMGVPDANLDNPCLKEKSISIGKEFTEGFSYAIKIEIFPITPNSFIYKPMEAYVSIKLLDGYEVVDDMGVFLKRQTDFSEDGFPENIRRYYYSDINYLNPTLEDLPFYDSRNHLQFSREIVNFECLPPLCCLPATAPVVKMYYTLSSEKVDYSQSPDFGFFEDVVISYGGDNFERGGIQKKFQSFPSFGTFPIITSVGVGNVPYLKNLFDGMELLDYNIPSTLNGALISEKYYTSKNNTLFKVLEKKYGYDWSEYAYEVNVVGRMLYKYFLFGTNCNISNSVSNYSVGQYKIGAVKNEITTLETKEFFEPIPLGALDESIYRTKVTLQTYSYGLYRNQPTIVTTTSGTSTSVTKNYYADQGSSLPGGPSTQTEYAILVANNVISTPIQTETFENDDLISVVRYKYKKWFNSNYRILPEYIQVAKGDYNFRDNIIFTSYDYRSNVTQLSKVDGTTVNYRYNSYNNVIRKLVNTAGLIMVEPNIPENNDWSGEITPLNSQQCAEQLNNPNALVTTYFYNNNALLEKTTNPRCEDTYYFYNSLHQLKTIKDHSGNILQEFDAAFKR